jgi:hypothetical protein
MDESKRISDRELEGIESRLDSFSETFDRVTGGEGYNLDELIAEWSVVASDMRRLIEQERARQ